METIQALVGLAVLVFFTVRARLQEKQGRRSWQMALSPGLGRTVSKPVKKGMDWGFWIGPSATTLAFIVANVDGYKTAPFVLATVGFFLGLSVALYAWVYLHAGSMVGGE